jgi:hypothetical protein
LILVLRILCRRFGGLHHRLKKLGLASHCHVCRCSQGSGESLI